MRALTALGAVGRTLQNNVRPPEMPLEDILPDPDNPREPFDRRSPEDQQKQLDLNTDIGKRGVKSPISIRPHATIPGKWIINYGHCRYEAAQFNKLKTIPYFVDTNFDSYDQVNENELRSNLSPWALASFIERKVKAGESKGEIAARLHKKGQNIITEFLALVDPPAILQQAYVAGVKSPRTLYDLRRAWDEHPEQVEGWVSSNAKITRTTIKEFVEQLRHDVKPSSENLEPNLYVDSNEDVLRVVNSHETTVPANDDRVTSLVAGQESSADTDETGELRHDVKPVQENQSSVDPVAPPGIESTSHELRHDVKPTQESKQLQTPLASPKAPATTGGIMVQYKGKAATIPPNATVVIVVDGHDAPLEVPLSEVIFKGVA